MQNKTNTTLLVLIVILLAICAWFLAKKANGPKYSIDQQINGINTNPPANLNPTVIGPDAKDLVSFSVKAGDTVSGKVKANGVISGGYFFEANIVVNILDVNKNIIKKGNGSTSSDWMTSGPVAFTTDLDFTGLPTGPGYIEIKNDNPSGDEGYQKQILIPIVIGETLPASVSTILPKYISGQKGWPPVVQELSTKYSCTPGTVGMGVKVKTTEKTINGKVYCVAMADEGAAGSIYKTYTYTTFGIQGSSRSVTFTLKYQSCSAYNPGDAECYSAQSKFDSNLDAIVASLM